MAEDFISQLANSIEQHNTILFDKVVNNSTGQLKLLVKRYNIDTVLYDRAKANGIVDPYYDKYIGNKNFNEQLIEEKQIDYYNIIFDKQIVEQDGYRHAYHCLLYGFDKCQSIIDWWKTLMNDNCFTPDMTFEAACDFFNLPHTTFYKIIFQKVQILANN